MSESHRAPGDKAEWEAPTADVDDLEEIAGGSTDDYANRLANLIAGMREIEDDKL